MYKFYSTLILAVLAITSCKSPLEETPPNIILIYADDLGRGMLSHEGQQFLQTPILID
ncbi:hypothetical protein [Echinicola sediminis]